MDLRTLGALLALLLLGAPPASAQLQNAEDICIEPEEQLDPGRFVRALSLDLRGTLPSELETNASIDWGNVPDGLVDEWLEGEGFLDRVVRHHRALTWNSVRNVTLLSSNQSLRLDNGIYWRRNASRAYRGNEVQCANEPARWDNDGHLRTRLVDGARLEGWVSVGPEHDDSHLRVRRAGGAAVDLRPGLLDARRPDGPGVRLRPEPAVVRR